MSSLIAGIDFTKPPQEVAKALLGATLLVDGVGGRIVEAEAYDGEDPASHSFGGATRRNASMFGEPGRAYVYRSHGLHWCLNVVCGPAGRGEAVLIRALEPTHGLEAMRKRRGKREAKDLCSGPGKLCQALGVDDRLDGADLGRAPFEWIAGGVGEIVACPRVGISKGVDSPWRFVEAGSVFLSRPAGKAP